MIITTNEKKHSKNCLVTNFRTMVPENIDLINTFNSSLKKLGITLILLTQDTSDKLECYYIKIPTSLDKFSTTQIEDIKLNLFNEDLIKIDMEFNDDLDGIISDYEKGMRKFYSFAHFVIHEIKPTYAFLWSSTLPQSIIFKSVLSTHFIPTFYWERGLLPETLMFEEVGNGALSNQKTNYNQQILLDNFNTNNYEVLKEYYVQRKIEKHTQEEFVENVEFLKDSDLYKKKILVFFGQWDVASGVNKVQDLQTNMNSPIFSDTRTAFQEISKYVSSQKDFILIFKPHPYDSTKYTATESLGIYLTKRTNIHSLMKIADIMLFMSTTVQYEAIFYEKPLVLLGNSLLNGLNIGYEIYDKNKISEVITNAIKKTELNTKLENSKRYLSKISQNYLIASTNNSPIESKIEDFLTFIFTQPYINRFKTYSSDEIDLAISRIKNKLKTDISEQVYSLIQKSETLIAQNNLIEARELLTNILINIDNNSVEAANNLVVVDIMLGNHRNAKDLLAQILEEVPSNKVALENLKYLESQKK